MFVFLSGNDDLNGDLFHLLYLYIIMNYYILL